MYTDFTTGWTVWGLHPGRFERLFSSTKRPDRRSGVHPDSELMGTHCIYTLGVQKDNFSFSAAFNIRNIQNHVMIS